MKLVGKTGLNKGDSSHTSLVYHVFGTELYEEDFLIPELSLGAIDFLERLLVFMAFTI